MTSGIAVKYVMVDRTKPVFFDNILSCEICPSGSVTSAGVFVVMNGKVHTGGDSYTLNYLEPAERDAEIIEAFLRKRGLL
jgi:hypothetical protein